MAKSQSIGVYQDPHDDLYAQIEDRRRRHLFLPNVLDEAAKDLRLKSEKREAAYDVIRKWWQLAGDGKLNRKETSIDDKFLSEVFGDALGYRGVTEAAGNYERERQFTVPGVGPCDGALGMFPKPLPQNVRVIIELKDAQTNLDHDRSSGRTAVQQLWDYLNAMPESCVWGVASNFTTIRLYHRAKGSQAYEQFRLKEMAQDRKAFERFFSVFEPYGLLRPMLHEPPRAIGLLEQSARQQNEVGDELYRYYSEQRLSLIEHLRLQKRLPLEAAIRVAQKIIDRVLFIAFCEDRGLVAADVIGLACKRTAAFDRNPNPIWRNFLGLFDEMNRGGSTIGVENGYNGGLFAEDPDFPIESLDLEDIPWTEFFRGLAGFDYEHTVDVEILGHLFEKSITELERLRQGGLFAKDQAAIKAPLMPKSPQRKLFGIYYTPVEFTTAIVSYTIDELVTERFAAVQSHHLLADERLSNPIYPQQLQSYWLDCLEVLRNLKICDPACGSGAFLIRAYDALYRHYALAITELDRMGDPKPDLLMDDVPDEILRRNLHGVDLQPEAVEIAQLSLWLRTARAGKTLANLSENIVCGNSLTDDPAAHPRAIDWAKTFPRVFEGKYPGFDCIIGNPPWERLKLQEREFFALSAPGIAAAVSAADRRRQIAAMETGNPELFAKYREALEEAGRMLTYVRKSKRYPLTGKGDINTYALFAELATKIVSPAGRVGLLVPSGIATDKTTANFFNELMANGTLQRLYDFENRKLIFPDIDGRMKFSIISFRGTAAKSKAADFVFFVHEMAELKQRQRHIALTSADMKQMNPNTKTCPVFRHRRDAEITKAIYGRVRILIDRNRREGRNRNPWGIRFVRMLDQTNDAELFKDAEALRKEGCRQESNRWVRGNMTFLPLYEAKMVQAYDHRAASVKVVETTGSGRDRPSSPPRSSTKTLNTSLCPVGGSRKMPLRRQLTSHAHIS